MASKGEALTISLWFGKRNVVGKPGTPGEHRAELNTVEEATSFPQNIIFCHIQFVR